MIDNIELLLTKHIKERLFNNGFVIIPNWGALYLEPVSAYFDEKHQLFSPPQNIIFFNSNIKQNDGVLIISIVQETNISYFGILKAIKDLTSQWNFVISNKGKIYLKGLGTFEQNSTSILFTSERFCLLSPEYYGLKELTLENTNVEHSIIFSFPESQQKAIRNWIKAAIFIPIALTFSLLPSKINHYSFESLASFIKNEKETSISIVSENIEKTFDTLTNLKVALNPKIEINNLKLSDNKLNTNSQINKTDTKQKTSNTIASKHYYIIIGSLTTMKQVNEFQKMLEDKKITGTVVLNCNGKLRIAYKKYENRGKANESLEQFKKNYPDLSGWILYW